MADYTIEWTELEAKPFFGLHAKSGDRRQQHDIPALSRRVRRITGAKRRELLPFCVLSRNYDPASGEFDLFVGCLRPVIGLEPETLPAGHYAAITVRPKLGLFWGAAIGEAKRWFYETWLPASGYASAGFEFELHTEASVGRRPTISLCFAVSPSDTQ